MTASPTAPAEGRYVYFISDLHLGARYLADAAEHERRAAEWLDSIAADAKELYMLGDVLDYWYEYRTVVPRGYVRFFGALARLADRGVKIYWFIGNHDIWLFDYLRTEIGLEVVDGSMVTDIMGKRFYLAHGDGVGQLPATFRLLRATFRNRFAQWLYGAIHPRWTIPFALRWSASSRGHLYDAEPSFDNPEQEKLVIFSRQYLAEHPDIDYFIYGHRHVLVEYELAPGKEMVILGDWFHYASYARFDGEKLEICRFAAKTDAANVKKQNK